ncbi:MAG: amidohydrolase [Kiritimatiellae bacterium]|nr:amidohydrolase [Kiritimatiellia bacterium]
MFDLLIQDVLWQGQRVDVAITGDIFAAIEPAGTLAHCSAKRRIEGRHFLLRPPFYNTHTHHAMTLLRGAGEDLPLMAWLNERIWPREARLTADAVAAGTRLAIVESLHTGCVAFNDMYFHQPAILAAAQEMGVRACVGLMFMDQVSDHIENEATLALREGLPKTLALSLAPHALYTTTPEQLQEIAHLSDTLGLPIHVHAAETQTECHIAQTRFNAPSPIAYLDRCGVLKPGTILAHCCHLSEEDLATMAARGVVVAHCPQSNQKLGSGVFPWVKAREAGIPVTIGTDGAASNNSLSMIAEVKAAALSAKLGAPSPESVTLSEVDAAATRLAAQALGFTNAGEIAPGRDADCLLVDLRLPAFAAGNNPDADFIYAADSACVDTVICAGRIVMEGKVVPGEAEILAKARAAATILREE